MSTGLWHALRGAFERRPDTVLLDVPGRRAWTYGEVAELSARIATRLSQAGARPGERVLVQVGKSPEAVATYLACLRSGATYVPLNPAYTSAEVGGFVRDCEPVVVVCEPERRGEHGSSALTLGTDGSGSLLDGVHRLDRLPAADVGGGDIAAMLYTSGTTGRSKGALLSNDALIANARALCEVWGMGGDDVLVHPLPIFHTHGLFVAMHTAMLAGARVRLLPRFDVDAVIDSLPAATMMMGVPTHYIRLLASGRLTREVAGAMRVFISGSAPLSSDASDRFLAVTGHRILERYGMTEAGMITSNPLTGDRVAGTVGFPLPGYEVRVRAETGDVVGAGRPGVLEIRGPHLFSGYWRVTDSAAAGRAEDGFFVTGDVVVADGEGRITVVGRASDVVISGGLNVYPREVEQVLDAVPGVLESAVVGTPDDDLGEAVTAYVVADGAVDETALLAAAAGSLAGFKRPRRYVFVGELPRNAMGKVQRRRLAP